MEQRYNIRRLEFDGIVRYIVKWSPYIRMDRFTVRGMIPSEGGIYQIFYRKNRLLNHIVTNMAYFGGLRNSIREIIDPLSPIQVPYKDFIAGETCYCRYSESPSMRDLQNVLNHFTGSVTEDSRFIEVEEQDTMKILL